MGSEGSYSGISPVLSRYAIEACPSCVMKFGECHNIYTDELELRGYSVDCPQCGTSGPEKTVAEEAVASWNAMCNRKEIHAELMELDKSMDGWPGHAKVQFKIHELAQRYAPEDDR